MTVEFTTAEVVLIEEALHRYDIERTEASENVSAHPLDVKRAREMARAAGDLRVKLIRQRLNQDTRLW